MPKTVYPETFPQPFAKLKMMSKRHCQANNQKLYVNSSNAAHRQQQSTKPIDGQSRLVPKKGKGSTLPSLY